MGTRRITSIMSIAIAVVVANLWRINLRDNTGYRHHKSIIQPQHYSKTAPKPANYLGDDDESLTFSGCLLIKDQNDILPEWLTYHWTVLPLRRLIVAVDPLSITDPTPFLDLYKSLGMNITVWKNDSIYWKDGSAPHEKLAFVISKQ